MSKGSDRRPLQTPLKEFNKRWDKAFEKKDTEEEVGLCHGKKISKKI